LPEASASPDVRRRTRAALRRALFSAAIAVSALGASGTPRIAASKISLDTRLRALVGETDWRRLSEARERAPAANDPIVRLGRTLFFSQALGGGLDTACASCHHPLLGGGDGLALPIGVDARVPERLGPGRRHAWRHQGAADPRADGGPNVPRNANTVFNVSLYRRALFHDGRVALLGERPSDGILTPDSLPGRPDPRAGSSLLAAQARFPIVSPAEMRGFRFEPNALPGEVRRHIAARLRGDGKAVGELTRPRWVEAFRRAYADRTTPPERLVTFARVTEALAAYERALVFVDSPWLAYVSGDDSALSPAAKRGALLFFGEPPGAPDGPSAAGCARCHRGPTFSDEAFHVLAVPQFGRGRGPKQVDLGRYSVTLDERDRYAFRTPSLLNVSVTAPYGHDGAFPTLASVIRHHLSPERSLAAFDFTDTPAHRDARAGLAAGGQSARDGVRFVYPYAERNSRAALATLEGTRGDERRRLPEVALDPREIADLEAFLESLTDPCTREPACLEPWLPDPADPGPGGMLLHARIATALPSERTAPSPAAGKTGSDPAKPPLSRSSEAVPGSRRRRVAGDAAAAGRHREPRSPPAAATSRPPPTLPSQDRGRRETAPPDPDRARFHFVERAASAGLHWAGGYAHEDAPLAYLHGLLPGGVAVADYDEDGDPDLYVVRGTREPNLLLRNDGHGHFTEVDQASGAAVFGDGAAPLFVDLNGDGRLDIFISGIRTRPRVLIQANGATFRDATAAAGLRLGRGSLGAAFADVDRDGDLDLALALFDLGPGIEREHLWLNDGRGRFRRGNRELGLGAAFSGASRNPSAVFTDLNGDLRPDLLLAGARETSRVFLNQRDATLADLSDPTVLHDPQPRGSAIGDYDNDGDPDWFVSGVSAPPATGGRVRGGPGAWGSAGNHLYRNDGSGRFHEVAGPAGVRNGGWGGGACFADFDNDGWLDLLQVGGIRGWSAATRPLYRPFEKQAPRLYAGGPGGRFRDVSRAAGLSNGASARAVACLDVDGDGDIDALALGLDGTPALYLNESRTGHALTVTLRGPAGNRQAVGARAVLRISRPRGAMRQVREVRVSSTFGAQESTRLHFGLGRLETAGSLSIHWPGPAGIVTRLDGLHAGRHTILFPARQEPARHAGTPPASVQPGTVTSRPPAPCSGRGTAALSGLAGGAPPANTLPPTAGVPRFTDVTAEAGLLYLHHRYRPARYMQIYATGSAAAGDFDGDGWTDLYVTRIDDSDILYRNQGDGTFADVTEQAFGPHHMADVASSGAAWGDVDNDGDLDLYVTSLFSTRYHLFINDGHGHFSEEALERGAAIAGPDPHFGFSVAFGDYDRDGALDIHTTEWRMSTQLPGRLAAHPPPGNARLLHNDGTGHFEDVTRRAGVSMDGLPATLTFALEQSFASRFTDLDGDGFPDLAVASDHGTSRLFWNNGDGTFRDGTRASGVGRDEYGMGSAVGDYDGDGDLDWFVSSVFRRGSRNHTGNRLYRNDRGRQFTDATDSAGVRDGGWAWGSAFLDVDNDGDLDLAVTNGFNLPQQFFPPVIARAHGRDRNRLWLNDGRGHFTEAAKETGFASGASGRGLLTWDYDRDGDLDIFVVTNAGRPHLFRNELRSPKSGKSEDTRHAYLQFELRGTRSNRYGIGARVTVTPSPGGKGLVRELSAGSHYLGQSEPVLHFGLAGHTGPVEQVSIRWPSGVRQVLNRIGINQRLTVTEPAPAKDRTGIERAKTEKNR